MSTEHDAFGEPAFGQRLVRGNPLAKTDPAWSYIWAVPPRVTPGGRIETLRSMNWIGIPFRFPLG